VVECTDCVWLSYWITAGLRDAGWDVGDGKPKPLPPPPLGTVPFSPAVAKGGQMWDVSVVSNDISSGSPAAELYEALLTLIGKMGGLLRTTEMPDGAVRIIIAPRP
jgi:hypothetical protein